MAHRAEAQRLSGITDAQQAGLARGRVKGTNHRTGYAHRQESKAKASASHLAFWAAHPHLAIARGAKIRGEAHYAWNGGINRLNTSVRQMRENRKWMYAVKARDGVCLRCCSTDRLEAHHRIALAELLDLLGIRSREDARRHANALWDIANGDTLCQACHYTEHGRVRRAS